MKRILAPVTLAITSLLVAPGKLWGADAGAESWHAKTLGEALGMTALFALVGIVIAVLGYKIFDFCTPGDLQKEIVENKNVAAAIVGAAVIVGVCIIIAAAIMG